MTENIEVKLALTRIEEKLDVLTNEMENIKEKINGLDFENLKKEIYELPLYKERINALKTWLWAIMITMMGTIAFIIRKTIIGG